MKSKGIHVLVFAMVLMLLNACGSVAKDEPDTYDKNGAKVERFSGEDDDDVYLIKDNLTGCEYIYAGSYRSSWTYVHGSCPEIIAAEHGIDKP